MGAPAGRASWYLPVVDRRQAARRAWKRLVTARIKSPETDTSAHMWRSAPRHRSAGANAPFSERALRE
jgi:hypothetical protein